ncbi:MAG: cytochrome oxidase putative small subunit CydP [Rhizomicrobium sp.]
MPARHRLGREIGALLCAKVILLGALYFLFFGPGHRAPHDAAATASHVMGER